MVQGLSYLHQFKVLLHQSILGFALKLELHPQQMNVFPVEPLAAPAGAPHSYRATGAARNG